MLWFIEWCFRCRLLVGGEDLVVLVVLGLGGSACLLVFGGGVGVDGTVIPVVSGAPLVDKLVLFLIIAVPERWLLADVEAESWLWMGVILVVAGSAVGDGERRSESGDLGGSHCEGVDVGVEGEGAGEVEVEVWGVGCEGWNDGEDDGVEADDADEKPTFMIGHCSQLIYMVDLLRRRYGIAVDFSLRCCYTPRSYLRTSTGGYQPSRAWQMRQGWQWAPEHDTDMSPLSPR